MFRFAILIDNGESPQTFSAQQVIPDLLFHSDYRYLIAALLLLLTALCQTFFSSGAGGNWGVP